MNLEPALALATIGHALVAASGIAAGLGLIALAFRRPLRALSPPLQAWLWWLVAARLLLQLLGAPAVELAWLPAAEKNPPEVSIPIDLAELPPSRLDIEADAGSAGLDPKPSSRRPPISDRPAQSLEHSARTDPWTLVGGVWLVGVLGVLLRGSRSLIRRRRMLQAAEPVSELEIAGELEHARRLAAVARDVTLRRSDQVTTPLVAGLLRPTVVLPAGARLSESELRLTLVHELVHVRRWDALRALVPAVARGLFFFHPVARLANREFGLATEAACDAEVVRLCGGRAESYGALLLRFALPPHLAARFATTWPLGGRVIQRRLDMLVTRHRRPRHLVLASGAAAIVALALATPVRLVAGDGSSPSAEIDEAALPAPAAEAEPAVGARWAIAPPTPAPPPSNPDVAPLPRALAAPVAAMAPLPPVALLAVAPAAPALAIAPPVSPALLATPPSPGPSAALAPLPPIPPIAPTRAPEIRGADWLFLADRGAHLCLDAPRWAQQRADEIAEREGRAVVLIGRGNEIFVVRDTATVDGLRRLFFEDAESARSEAEAAREAARLSLEQNRRALEATRQSLLTGQRGVLDLTAELERTARREAARVAALGNELARQDRGEVESVVAKAQEATRALEALEAELARVREVAERARAEAETARRRAIEENRLQIETSRAEAERQRNARRQQVQQELEQRLEAIFEQGLAVPLTE